jgi:hypothetical protein
LVLIWYERKILLASWLTNQQKRVFGHGANGWGAEAEPERR